MIKLQLARATLGDNGALRRAVAIVPYVNILEVGTTLTKSVGMNTATKLKAAYSDKTVLTDLKSSSRYMREIWFE